MISSSTDPVARPPAPQPPPRATAWNWAELEPGGGVAGADAATGEAHAERHRQEVEEAYRRGAADGRAASATAARNELAQAMSAALEALEHVRANRELWAGSLRENLVVLSAAIASQIVERELRSDPEIFADLAKRAVAAFPGDESLRIRLNPADLERLQAGEESQADDVVGSRTIRWIVDEDVVEGGCVVEGPDKIMDGRVDEVLARIVSVLTRA